MQVMIDSIKERIEKYQKEGISVRSFAYKNQTINCTLPPIVFLTCDLSRFQQRKPGREYGKTQPRPIDLWFNAWNDRVKAKMQSMIQNDLYPNLNRPLEAELNLSFALHSILSIKGRQLLGYQAHLLKFTNELRRLINTKICLTLVDCCLNSQDEKISVSLKSTLFPDKRYKVQLSRNVHDFLEKDLNLQPPFELREIVTNLLNLTSSLRPDIISLPYFGVRPRAPPIMFPYLMDVNLELLTLSMEHYATNYNTHDTFEPMPVIQVRRDVPKPDAYSIVNQCINNIRQLCSTYNITLRWIGYGTCMPFGGNIKQPLLFDFEMLRHIRSILFKVRDMVPLLHSFGVGSPSTVALFSMICDSTECHAWEFVGGQGQVFPLLVKDTSSQKHLFKRYGAFSHSIPTCDPNSIGHWVILSQAYLRHSRECNPPSTELTNWMGVRPKILEDDYITYMYENCQCPYCHEVKQRNLGIDVYARELCPSRNLYPDQTYNDCRRIHNAWVLYEVAWIIRYTHEDELKKFCQAVLCFRNVTHEIQVI